MEPCIVSSTEELTDYLDNHTPERLCVTHRRGFDACAPAAAAARMLANRHGAARVVCLTQPEVARVSGALDGATGIEVLTAADLALGILDAPAVQTVTGRGARVLDANEMDVLLEDMKVTGMQPRRLREMLKFFFKSLCDGTADEQGWLISAEEQQQFAILEENLEAREAMLSHEAARLAQRGLRAAPDAAEPLPTVVVDYGALSLMSQTLVAEACDGVLVAFGAEEGAPSPAEPYPHFAGLAQLIEGGADHLAWESVARPGADVSLCSTPTDEFAHVAGRVEDALREGATVVVATPNGTWSTYLGKQLAQRGITFEQVAGNPKAKGDPRYAESCAAVEAQALAKLRANRDDLTALRTWIGCGDWLLRSDAWLELMAWAREHEMTVREALPALRSMPAEERGMKLFHKIEQRLDALDAALAAEPTDEAAPAPADPAASTDAADARVTIATYDHCRGLSASHVFVTGLVNGFLPHLDAVDDKHSIEQKQRAQARDRELFNDLLSLATDRTEVSLFRRDAAANAERLTMDVSRIYQSGDTRMVDVNPSMFIHQ